MKHSRSSNTFRLAKQSAPLLALAAMLLLPLLLPCTFGDAEAIAFRKAQVQAAVTATPYRFGGWVSDNAEVPPAAIKLLRPNAILSRHYRELDSGLTADLLVVHCGDARDMAGHYPPICYPAHGWQQVTIANDPRAVVVSIGDATIPMCVYGFRRTDDLGTEHRLRVFNCFLLPNGEAAIDMDAVRQLADRPSITTHGVAQVQIVMSGGVDLDLSEQAVSQLLTGVSSLLAVLGQGAEYDYAIPTR